MIKFESLYDQIGLSRLFDSQYALFMIRPVKIFRIAWVIVISWSRVDQLVMKWHPLCKSPCKSRKYMWNCDWQKPSWVFDSRYNDITYDQVRVEFENARVIFDELKSRKSSYYMSNRIELDDWIYTIILIGMREEHKTNS